MSDFQTNKKWPVVFHVPGIPEQLGIHITRTGQAAVTQRQAGWYYLELSHRSCRAASYGIPFDKKVVKKAVVLQSTHAGTMHVFP